MTEEHMEIPGIMARLWLACRVIIWIIIEEGDDQSPGTHMETLKKIEHRLLKWNSDHMVDNSHMDMTLQRSQGLWKATIVPLRSLTRVLAFDMPRYVSPRARQRILEQRSKYQSLLDESKFATIYDGISDDGDSGSEYDDDTSEIADGEETELETCLRKLSLLVQCLFDLDDALDKPVQDPEYREQAPDREKLFACPFYKRHPERFTPGTKAWVSCAARGWTIMRLKEHIYRVHCPLPYRCSRCFKAYEKEEDLTQHQRATTQCSIALEQPECEGLDKSQINKVSKRHIGRVDLETWCIVYRVIFHLDEPDRIPNPFWRADNILIPNWEQKNDSEAETIHSLSDFREFLDVLSKEGNSDTEGEDQICMRLLQTFSGTGPLDLL